MHDLAILRRAAELLGEPLYAFSDDFKDYFPQLAVAECDLHKLNFIFLAEADDGLAKLDQYHLPQSKHGQLLFVSERRLGFGTHGASNLAQRFSDALLHLFRHDMDAAEAAYGDERWARARRQAALEVAKRRGRAAPSEQELLEQSRLYAAYCFTDDGLFLTVGVGRTLRALDICGALHIFGAASRTTST